MGLGLFGPIKKPIRVYTPESGRPKEFEQMECITFKPDPDTGLSEKPGELNISPYFYAIDSIDFDDSGVMCIYVLPAR